MKVYFWGTGRLAGKVIDRHIPLSRITGFIDNDKNKKKHKRNLIGTGLGLNIVKKILEQHKFNYGVTSKLNVGTTIYFEIKK